MSCHHHTVTTSVWFSLIVCLILAVGLTSGLGPNQQFTFLLPAGSTECFYQTSTKNNSIDIDYQVIAGSGLDVGFVLISPNGYRLISDFRKSDAFHTVDPTEDGDYRFCFDNSFSKLSEKMVFFEVTMKSQSSTAGGRDEWADIAVSESMVEYKLEDIRASMDLVYQHLERSGQIQTVLRTFEARDRYLLEDNLWRVSFWSCLNLLVMLTVAVVQICTLRSLFEGPKRVCT
ncbi:transmembrane emp24 domain-containing protein 1-like [Menidia menidia]